MPLDTASGTPRQPRTLAGRRSLLACFLCTLLALWGCASKPTPIHRGTSPLSQEERDYLIGVARKALTQYYQDGTELKVNDLPPALRRFHKKVVFATFHMDGDTRGCYSAGEADVATNVVASVLRTVHDDRYYVKGLRGPKGKEATLRPEEVGRVRIELNILHNYERLAFTDPDSLRGEIEPGVHGVRLSKGKNGAYYLPYVAIEFEYDIAPYLRTLAHKAGLQPQEWQKGASLWKFDSENFVEEKAVGRALPLLRWNVLASEVDAKSLDTALERAGAFVAAVSHAPAPYAAWHPKKKQPLGAAEPWLLAWAASLWPSQVSLPGSSAGGGTRDAEGSGAQSGAQKGPLREPGPGKSAATDSRAASAAYTCLASLHQKQPALERARRACDELMAMQTDGSFPVSARGVGRSWEREHHEAVVAIRALSAYSSATQSPSHLDVARRLFTRANSEHGGRLTAQAELVVAAMALHAADPTGGHLAQAKRLGQRLLGYQVPLDRVSTTDQRGTLNFDRIPTSADTARAAHAFALLAAAGDPTFRRPAEEAARFTLHLQYRPESAFAFPEIPRYLGGVRVDLHHVAADLESTLEAAQAWAALKRVAAPATPAR